MHSGVSVLRNGDSENRVWVHIPVMNWRWQLWCPWGDGVLCNSGSHRKHPGLGIWELGVLILSIGIHGKLCSSSVGTTALQSGWKEKRPLLLSFSLGRHFPCTHGLPTICHLHPTVEKEGASKSKDYIFSSWKMKRWEEKKKGLVYTHVLNGDLVRRGLLFSSSHFELLKGGMKYNLAVNSLRQFYLSACFPVCKSKSVGVVFVNSN